MSTGKKTKSVTPALSRRIVKLTAELKTARKNLRDAVRKAAREANVWKRKLATQNSHWEAKLKKVEGVALQKCVKLCAKKEITKKKALHRAWIMAEAKFEKAYTKKRPKKKVKAKAKKGAVKKVAAKKHAVKKHAVKKHAVKKHAVKKAAVKRKPARKVKKAKK